MTDTDLRGRLLELVRRHGLRQAAPGETFTLASGRQSTWFVNGKEVTLRAEGLALVAELMFQRLAGSGVQAVGGMVIGADPMVGAIVARSAVGDMPLQGFLVRKAAKDHGLGDQLAGPSLEGIQRVAVVEDVTTTGGSSMQAIEAVRAAWPAIEVDRVLTLVDRQEGAAEAFAAQGIRLDPLFTRADLGV